MELRRTHRRATLVLLALGLVASVLAGCTSGATLHPRTAVTASTRPGDLGVDPAGTVTVAVPSLPHNFNPSTPAGDNPVTAMIMEQVWPQPFVTDPTFNLDTSELLSSAEVQGLAPFTVVYTINPKAVWSDGTPITASDFVYEWHELLAHSARLADSGVVAGYRDIGAITSKRNGRTVTVVFRRPYSQWQSLFADLVPSRVAERWGWVKGFSSFNRDRVLSGGPFEITAVSPGRSLVLSRNPSYWGTPAHVAHIRFVVERSTAALLRAMRSGSVSVGEVPLSTFEPGTVADGLAASDGPSSSATSTHGGVSGGLAWSSYASETLWQLCFNVGNAATRQLALREGLEHSLDRSEVVADSEELADARIKPALGRLTVAGESSNPNVPGTSPIVPKAPALYEPARALGFFRAAGYRPGRGGLLRSVENGAPLRVLLTEPRSNWAVDQAGLVIQAELRSVGVLVTLVKVTMTQFLSKLLPSGRFELALVPFSVSTDLAAMAPEYSNPIDGTDAQPLPTDSWATAAPKGEEPGAAQTGAVTRDVCGLDDRRVNRDLERALGELNPPQAIADVEHAEAALWDDAAVIPLFQAAWALVRSTRLDNVSESPTWAGVMWNAPDWALRRARASKKAREGAGAKR